MTYLWHNFSGNVFANTHIQCLITSCSSLTDSPPWKMGPKTAVAVVVKTQYCNLPFPVACNTEIWLQHAEKMVLVWDLYLPALLLLPVSRIATASIASDPNVCSTSHTSPSTRHRQTNTYTDNHTYTNNHTDTATASKSGLTGHNQPVVADISC